MYIFAAMAALLLVPLHVIMLLMALEDPETSYLFQLWVLIVYCCFSIVVFLAVPVFFAWRAMLEIKCHPVVLPDAYRIYSKIVVNFGVLPWMIFRVIIALIGEFSR
jgi:hypothetical protein